MCTLLLGVNGRLLHWAIAGTFSHKYKVFQLGEGYTGLVLHIPLATSTTVLSGLDFCANCDFCVKSWVRGICMWRILWFWCFLMIRRRIRVLHVDQFGRSQDWSRPVFVPTQTKLNEKGIQGLQGFYFFCANCIKGDELIEPTGPNRSFHLV